MSKLSQTKIKVLNQFEIRTDDWRTGDFENALSQAMGPNYGNYQTAKSTIVEADKEGKWPNTVKKYVLSNYRAFGNAPMEFQDIVNRLFSSMSIEERASFN
ncbi:MULTISPECIES: hypothetical protein [unclassified Pseudomonas]|jgi:hypothetical protein|uniref:hypothetical protein n=1 Tax=unclassified Pseudomonas TaxID=196821 RepID=UPI000D3CCDD6|nr:MULTISPECIES: hypothetical protein [unclassified Pseudomonas]